MVNARMKASPIKDMPKQLKKSMSRTSPNNLETTVNPLTSEILLANLTILKIF